MSGLSIDFVAPLILAVILAVILLLSFAFICVNRLKTGAYCIHSVFFEMFWISHSFELLIVRTKCLHQKLNYHLNPITFTFRVNAFIQRDLQ